MKNLLLAKRGGLALLVLLLMLIAVMTRCVGHIDLLAAVSDQQGAFFTTLTHSAGKQGFVVTLAVFCVGVMILRLTPTQLISKAAQLGLLLVIGFVAKTGLKQMTESPRPYTETLSHELLVPNPEHFYHLSAEQQESVIHKVSEHVSHWRTQHWLGETDYSFPSGHTIFVAICVAFFGGLFVEHKRYLLTAGVMVWALGVAYSRLWLGMHRPIDLMASVMFVCLLYLLVPNFNQLADTVCKRLKIQSHCSISSNQKG